MKKWLLSASLVSLLGVGQLLAGTLYLPVAKNQQMHGNTYQTQLWVSNPSDQPGTFSTFFIPSLVDGTVGDRQSQGISVAPGTTFYLSNVTMQGTSGMLEIEADPQLVFESELQPVDGDIRGAGARMPLVSSENLISGGTTAHIQGLERTDGGTVTNVGFLNLTREPNSCKVNVVKADGQQIGGTVVLNFLPLSHYEFPEALSILGLAAAQHVRLDATCTGDFFVYATILGSDPDETLFVGPSVSADSQLDPPAPPAEAVTMEKKGTFFQPRTGSSELIVELPLEPGVSYKEVIVDFDLFVDRFQGNLFHGIVGMSQPNGEGLYYGMFVRGDRRKTTFDLGKGQGFGNTSTNIWQEKTSYHLHFDYDVDAGLLNFKNSQGSTVLEEFNLQINSFQIIDDGIKVRLVFGLRKVFDGAYYPPIGWRFSNLVVKAFPEP